MFLGADEYRDSIRNMVRRATLSQNATVGSDYVVADFSGRSGERFSGVPISHGYGFHAEPLAGADALLLALGGRSDAVHCLGIDDPRGRPSLGPGAVAIWDNNGQIVSLVQKNIRVVSPTHIHLDAPTITSSVPITVASS